MGNCCSNKTVDDNDISTPANQLAKTMTMKEMAMLIKCQARIRGFLARKRVQELKNHMYQGGMGAYQYNEGMTNDYDN